MAPRTFLFVLILILSFIFFKYGTIETHARTLLPLNILAVGSVGQEIITKEYQKRSFLPR